MRIKNITLKNFGPFNEYKISFPSEDNVTLLLVGRNNEGKSTILRALKFIHDAFKVIGKRKFQFIIDHQPFYSLLKQDIGDIRIGRLIYNYTDEIGNISCEFSDGFTVMVFLDSKCEKIYADYEGKIPNDINCIFGIIPPLGPISENEEVISNINYLKANLITSLAPRHLRNYFYQLLTHEQFQLIKNIIKSSWPEIELDSYELDPVQNQLECYYKENNILREISWAGQGLQIWLQIITHFVINLDKQVIILDEPEVNLHPEKQNELLSIFNQYHSNCLIIATHSVELMNNININYILNTKKHICNPLIKTSKDINFLEKVRSNIGSNFNFVASQFEKVDYLFFTENVEDYKIIKNILNFLEINIIDFNIPIYGFQQYQSVLYYKIAYRKLLGRDPKYILILDKDYYPIKYLESIREKLKAKNIKVIYTPGKEIENIFIHPDIYKPIIGNYETFNNWLTDELEIYKDEIFSNYAGYYIKYAEQGKEKNTLIKESKIIFDSLWKNEECKYNLVPGKAILKAIRSYIKREYSITLTNKVLIELLYQTKNNNGKQFILDILEVGN